ncbi:jg10435 [Pararge aegeria aegeria]|uniref:Jg10435 protein n=1 Tax=Pararge aegeria aegeria TaxID=348720 RepID=A0A8S4RCG6_9NEOP|nr:jg10435 [Pararge aegeria aegeria]
MISKVIANWSYNHDLSIVEIRIVFGNKMNNLDASLEYSINKRKPTSALGLVLTGQLAEISTLCKARRNTCREIITGKRPLMSKLSF